MPSVGVRTAAVLLTTIGDGTDFPTAAHLASYADLAPTTKLSRHRLVSSMYRFFPVSLASRT